MYCVYILKCADKTLYTGIAIDLEKRLSEHNFSNLGAKYTRYRRPVQLVYSKKFRNRSLATKEEMRIKSLSREKKLEMIKKYISPSSHLTPLKRRIRNIKNNYKKNNLEKIEGLKMYFSEDVSEKFAKLEQNERNFQVAEIVDQILIQEIENFENPIYVAELGGGAHPDRYHKFFRKIMQKPKGYIDWVDISPFMLELAKKYINNEKYSEREKVVNFVESEICKYLNRLPDEKLNLAIMKYTFNYIKDIESLFKLLSIKIKSGGKFVSTIGSLNSELKSYSTNARYLYNGQLFPDNETKKLKDGDSFVIKFFRVSGDKDSGYLEGAEAVEYYHSAKKIKKLAETFGFDCFLGDWKNLVESEAQNDKIIDQDVFVLTKKNVNEV